MGTGSFILILLLGFCISLIPNPAKTILMISVFGFLILSIPLWIASLFIKAKKHFSSQEESLLNEESVKKGTGLGEKTKNSSEGEKIQEIVKDQHIQTSESVKATQVEIKRRWNRKKIVFWFLTILVVLTSLFGISIFIIMKLDEKQKVKYENLREQQKILMEFCEIPISATKSDVKFIKGKPTKANDEDNVWEYEFEDLVVFFDDNNVWAIIYFKSWCIDKNIGVIKSYKDITEKFGQPSNVSVSEDDLERILSFKKYHIFFCLRENKVYAYGMFNPELEIAQMGFRFKKEKKVEVKK